MNIALELNKMDEKYRELNLMSLALKHLRSMLSEIKKQDNCSKLFIHKIVEQYTKDWLTGCKDSIYGRSISHVFVYIMFAFLVNFENTKVQITIECMKEIYNKLEENFDEFERFYATEDYLINVLKTDITSMIIFYADYAFIGNQYNFYDKILSEANINPETADNKLMTTLYEVCELCGKEI